MSRRKTREQTPGEELANSITHGAGFVLSIACLVLVVVFAAMRRDAWRVVSCAIYGATLILLYASSTLYHGLRPGRAKHVFNILDHSAIYLLVAGTYTPFMLVPLRGGLGWTFFGLIWALAAAGIVYQALFINRYRVLSLVTYLGMGWLVVFTLPGLVRALPLAGLVWLALGGVLYTVGSVFYAWHSQRFAHAIWHVFVLGGSLCHFFGVLFYVVL